jgi:2,3-dihydroxy-p-cumate/2,3-dihydroxybenzoate 3,4-dioxygenase
MIDLHTIAYVRLGASDLNESFAFATKILGLEPVARGHGTAELRSDDRASTLCYVEGDPGLNVVGFELERDGSLDLVAAELEARGVRVRRGNREESERRHVEEFIAFEDPTGNAIEIVTHQHVMGRRYFPSRDAGITGFSHIGLRTSDAKRDEAFWTGVLGARVSDWIGDAALLRINPVHHTLALFPSPYAGVQHVNHQVASVDDVMRSFYFLRERGIRIVFGPGRHPTSGATFLYFEGPDRMTYEYSCGVKLIEDEAAYRPRQFPWAAESLCMWGSKPDILEFKADVPVELQLG